MRSPDTAFIRDPPIKYKQPLRYGIRQCKADIPAPVGGCESVQLAQMRIFGASEQM